MIEFPPSSRVYRTRGGVQLSGNSRELLRHLPDESVDLVVTSPPFALLRQKSYGNRTQADYVGWLGSFGPELRRILKPSGSLVFDLGGAYEKGKPVRSLWNYRVLLDYCDRLKFELAEEFFWFNPSKLPSPIEWVNKRKIRAKDSVNTIWWLSKTTAPKANISKVLVPYSARMELLLRDPDKYYAPRLRPSGHDIARAFGKRNAGAIPSNLLQIANTESNSDYLRRCKQLARTVHPARFPAALPEFFIKFLTDPGDLVVDIFSGSNTTGAVAERLGRRWVSIEIRRDFAALSVVRFAPGWSRGQLESAMDLMDGGGFGSLFAP